MGSRMGDRLKSKAFACSADGLEWHEHEESHANEQLPSQRAIALALRRRKSATASFRRPMQRPQASFSTSSNWKHRGGGFSRRSKYRSSNSKPEPMAFGNKREKREVDDFYSFITERESLRIRKELKRLPSHQWTSDDIMARIKLTNVRRDDDRTTRTVRRIVCDYVHSIPDLRALRAKWHSSGNAAQELRISACLLVFNCALWRAFGSDSFVQRLGFLQNMRSWGPTEQQAVIQVAMEHWHSGQFCFTDAYNPCKWRHEVEVKARVRGGPNMVREVYQETCMNLGKIFEACKQVANEAITTGSWRKTTKLLMTVPGYGGTGFLAKELVQDLLRTPLFQRWDHQKLVWVQACKDINDWCAVGPGARRGLNRLNGRKVNWNDTCNDQEVGALFLEELKDLYDQRLEHWGSMIEGYATFELELHDVQFQLCEFDKYERARLHQGAVRVYQPPRDDADSRWPSASPVPLGVAASEVHACNLRSSEGPDSLPEQDRCSASSSTREPKDDGDDDHVDDDPVDDDKYEERLKTLLDNVALLEDPGLERPPSPDRAYRRLRRTIDPSPPPRLYKRLKPIKS
eukprot:TRINITY_DN26342_c0_g1_i1.p1 TRINITY_DN26342_c0_g1~~TRINITY_DN26342_c0_g1_i1.p1  ORF type:complete len:574 (-),score=109.18 TRINITY_DN26342_c0_g1_i1:86-1807(-)